MRKLLLALIILLFAFSCKKENNYFMNLSQSSIVAPAEGGKFNVELNANVRVRMLNDISDWLKIDTVSVSGEITTLAFCFPEYDKEYSREGQVRFIGDHVEAIAFPVTQSAVVPKGISTKAINVEFDATSASFSVIENKPWTASSDNAGFVVNPASGSGLGIIKVTFPENQTTEDRIAHITVNIEGQSYVCTITQYGNIPVGILADWDFKALTEASKKTFGHIADTTVGFHDQYVAPSTGSGKIEYYACNKSSYPSGGLKTLRGVGANGDPYVRGTVPGDYWLVTADYGKRIPAGTNVSYSFITHFGNYTTNYWVLEYLDGDTWKPVSPLTEVTESATKGLSGTSVTYSQTLQYNVTSRSDAVGNGCYDKISGEFSTSVDMTSIVLKFRPVGNITLTQKTTDKNRGLYIDKNHDQVESRFSAQRPNNEAGNQVKTYDQHLTIEFIKK